MVLFRSTRKFTYFRSEIAVPPIRIAHSIQLLARLRIQHLFSRLEVFRLLDKIVEFRWNVLYDMYAELIGNQVPRDSTQFMTSIH